MFSQRTMQLVVNYLVTRPYNEVAGLIAMIAQEDEANKQSQEPKTVVVAEDASLEAMPKDE